MITITRDEAVGLVDLLETYLFNLIRDSEDIDSMEWLFNMTQLWKKCKDAEKEPETAAPMAEMARAAEAFMDVIDEVTETPKPEKTPEMPVFYGSKADVKREIYRRLLDLRTKGMTSVQISRMAGGKVTPDEVLGILAAAKVPFAKWEALGSALGVGRNEAQP